MLVTEEERSQYEDIGNRMLIDTDAVFSEMSAIMASDNFRELEALFREKLRRCKPGTDVAVILQSICSVFDASHKFFGGNGDD